MSNPSATLAANAAAGSGSATLAATVTTATPQGATLMAWVTVSAGQVLSVADSVNGAYALLPGSKVTNGSLTGAWYYAQNAQPLPITTSSITVTLNSSSFGKSVDLISVAGLPALNGIDLGSVLTAQGSGTAVSGSTGTLASPAELVLVGEANGGAGGAITWNAPFTPGLDAGQHAGTNQWASVGAPDTTTAGGTATATGTIAGTGVSWLTSMLAFPVAAIAGSWSNSVAAATGFQLPAPGNLSLPVAVTNTPGQWLFALIAWRQPNAGAGVTVSVEDDAHNWWDPVGAPSGAYGTSPASGVTRCAIWCAPAARAASVQPGATSGATNVMIAPSGPVLGIAAMVIAVSGLQPWFSFQGVDPEVANNATAISMALGVPSDSAFMLAIAGSDHNSTSLTGPSSPWASLGPVTGSNGVDHTADIKLSPFWQQSTSAPSASWSATAALDFSGVMAAVLMSAPAPAQPNPHWPIVITEIAPGNGALTPPDQLTWTDISSTVLAMNMTQGRQYTLGQLQAGKGTMIIDDPTGAAIPPGSGLFAGIDSGTPIRRRLIIPGQTCPHNVVMSALAQRWPPGFDNVERGRAEITIADVWSCFQAGLPTILTAEIQNDSPTHHWPLTDPAGATQASNLAQGGNGPPLIVTRSKYGSSGATNAFGTNTGALPGDTQVTIKTSGQTATTAGMWQQVLSGTSASTNGFGYTLSCADSGYPPITGGVTIGVFLEPQISPAPAWNPICWLAQDSRGPVLQLSINASTGVLLLTSWSAAGVQQTAVTVATNDYRNLAVPVTVHVAFNTTSYTVWVDGGGLTGSSGTFATALRASFNLLSFNGHADRFGTGGMWTGYVSHAAVFPSMLPQVRCLTHYYAGVAALPGDSATGRIERLLQAGIYTGRRAILAETSPDVDRAVTCSDIAGSPMATSLTNMAASCFPAMLAIAPTGAPYYLAKQYAYNQPVKWVIGTNTAAGELPYAKLGTGSLDYDPARVVNDIQLTHLDRQDVILPTGLAATAAAASQLQYGDQTYTQTGYLDGDATKSYTYGPGLFDLANWIAEVYGTPALRVINIEVDAAAYPAAWPYYAAAATGDMVQVNIRPPTMAPQVITLTGRITQTKRTSSFGEGGKPQGRIAVAVDAAPEYNALTLDDVSRGVLSGANVLAW